jgi:hypothetical protein
MKPLYIKVVTSLNDLVDAYELENILIILTLKIVRGTLAHI